MKKIPIAAFITAVILIPSLVNAQTATEIVNKHLNAIGGKEKLQSANTIYISGKVSFVANTLLPEGTAQTYLVNGKGLREEMQFNNLKVIDCFTGTGGWSVNDFLQRKTPEPMVDAQLATGRARLLVGGPLLQYADSGNRITLLGKENINGVQAYKLKLVASDKAILTFLIDPNTFYILKVTTKQAPDQPEEIKRFSDYRKLGNGLVFPYATELTLPQGSQLLFTVNSIEIDKQIDMALFKMPG